MSGGAGRSRWGIAFLVMLGLLTARPARAAADDDEGPSASAPASAPASSPASAPASSPASVPADDDHPDAADEKTRKGLSKLIHSAKSRFKPLSSFEEQSVNRALRLKKVEIDPEPDGKVITRIFISTEKILAESDIYPKFLNGLHTLTREKTIRRELLFEEGQVYDPRIIAETERELRDLIIFAVVRVIPVKLAKEGTVGVLVVTKDLWSLRTNFFFLFTSRLEIFQFNPSENNLAGRYKILTGHLSYDLGKFAFGEGFFEPRVFGTRIQALEDFWLEFSRDTGKPEGTRGRAFLNRPLYSLKTPYSWLLDVIFDHGIDRAFEAGRLRTFDADSTPWNDEIPRVWRRTEVDVAASVTRSFGYDTKHNFRLGAGFRVDRSSLLPHPPLPGPFLRPWVCPGSPERCDAPEALAEFVEKVLPAREQFLFVLLRYETARTRFTTFKNFGAFGTTEDCLTIRTRSCASGPFRLGHSVVTQALFGASLDGSPDFLELAFTVSYGWRFGDDMLQLWSSGRSRILSRTDAVFEGSLARRFVNNALDVTVRNAFPLLKIGRFHARVAFGMRESDLNRVEYCVGSGTPNPAEPVIGDGDLRGFDTNRFCGSTRLVWNLEFRTLPLNIWTVQVGAVAFWDNAFLWGGDEEGDRGFKSSVGIGLRGQLPQLDREAFRVDLGFPISGRVPGRDAGWGFTFTFLQVF